VVQKHVAFQVRFVRQNDLFQQIKSINEQRFQRAISIVMDQESVPQGVRYKFQMLYESTFNVALSSSSVSSSSSSHSL
jgi:hypothetical protein